DPSTSRRGRPCSHPRWRKGLVPAPRPGRLPQRALSGGPVDLYKKRKKRPDGSVRESSAWWVRFQHNGRDYRRSTGETNRREAARAGRRIRSEVEAMAATAAEAETPAPAVQPWTLAALAARDIADAESRGVSEPQQVSIEGSWVPVLAHFGCDRAP